MSFPTTIWDAAEGRHVARTSREARRALEPHRSTQSGRVLAYVASRGDAGATNEQICGALGLRVASGTARTRELVIAGLVADSGRTRASSSGRAAIAWVATPAGLAAVRAVEEGGGR